MTWRTRLILPVALVAALATAGCFPIVSNQQASQQDLIGDVSVSADVCTAPQLLGLIAGGIITRSELRSATRSGDQRRLGRGIPAPDDLLACPSEDELDDWLNDDPAVAAILGIPHQLLIAYRVPAGADAPATFEARGTVAVTDFWQEDEPRGSEPAKETIDVAFRRAPEMDAQLGALYDDLWSGLDDAPKVERDGTKLVGYISSQLPGPLVGDLNVAAGFGVPAGTVDQPYAGPFNALTMAGSRVALTSDQILGNLRRSGAPRALRGVVGGPSIDILDPQRPVECLDDELGGPPRGGPTEELLSLAICPMPTLFVSGTEDEVREQLTEATKGVDLTTRDLRVLGGEGFAEQGAAASVPFTLRGAGSASATQLGLSATSALAGATAAPAQATTPFPGAGDHGRSVTVQIPDTAAPGTYDVTLTAAVGGQQRTGTGRVVVLPKAPSFSSSALRGRDNVYMDRDGNIAFGWICPPACGGNQVDVTSPKAGIAPQANTAAVTKPRLLRIARGRFEAANARRARVKVRLFPRARKAVRKGRNVKAIIVVRTGGKGAPSVRRVTIKLRKPKR